MSDIFKPEDLHIESWPPVEHGMGVRKIPHGVRVVHLKSGVYVTCEVPNRSQHQNRHFAIAALEAIVTDPNFPRHLA